MTSSATARLDSPQRSSLATRMAWTLAVFGLLMAGAYFILVHRPLYWQLVAREEAQLRILYERVRIQQERDFEDARRELASIAALPEVQSLKNQGTMDSALEQAQVTTRFYRKFTVLDKDGVIRSRPSEPAKVGASRRSRPYFQETVRGRRLFVGNVREREEGLSLSIGLQIRGRDADLRGVLVGHIALSKAMPPFCRSADDWTAPHRVVLVDREGYAIARSGEKVPAKRLADADMKSDPMLRRPPVATTRIEYFQLDEASYVGLSSRLEPAGWSLVLQAERGPILARAQAAVGQLAVILGSVFLVLLGILGLVGWRVVQPIGALHTALVEFGRTGRGPGRFAGPAVGEVGAAIAAFHGMAEERQQAETDLRQQRSELQGLASELSTVEQKTRLEVAGELHDHLSQNLAAARIRLGLLRAKQESPKDEESLSIAIDLLSRSIAVAAGMTSRLARPQTQQLGLVTALRDLVQSFDSEHSGDGRDALRCQFESKVSDLQVGPELLDTLYRGVAELLHNVVKHAKARHVSVELTEVAGTVSLRVLDDGGGFTGDWQPPLAGQVGGFGIFALRERLRGFGGTLVVENRREGGCEVSVKLPRASLVHCPPDPEAQD